MKNLKGVITKLNNRYKEIHDNIECKGNCDTCKGKFGNVCICMLIPEVIEDLETINDILSQIVEDLK